MFSIAKRVSDFKENFNRENDKISFLQFFIIFSIVLLDFIGLNILTMVIPLIIDPQNPKRLLGVEKYSPGTAYSILQLSYGLGMLVSPTTFGLLSDQYGRRPLLLVCAMGPALAFLVQGFCYSFVNFSFLRFVIGIFGGGRPVALVYITDIFADSVERSKFLGLVNFAPVFAMAFSPTIGSVFSLINLQFPCFIVSAWAFYIFYLAFFYLPETLKKKGENLIVRNLNRKKMSKKRSADEKGDLSYPALVH